MEELDCCCGEGLGFEVARNDRREDMLVRECYQGAIMLMSENATVNPAMRLRWLCTPKIRPIVDLSAEVIFPRGAPKVLVDGKVWMIPTTQGRYGHMGCAKIPHLL